MTALVELGLNHEQQHQELILTDIKYNLAVNPLHPAYHATAVPRGTATAPLDWRELRGGLVPIGYDGAGFAFDNEGPRHTVYLRPFRLADRPTTNGEYLEPSSTPAGIARRVRGCRRAGARSRSAGGRRRSTGSGRVANGGRRRSVASCLSISTPRSRT